MFSRLVATVACVLLVAGCGHSGTASQSNVISCRSPDADRPACVEYEPYNGDMRLVASNQCREGGGTVGTSCPTELMVGACDYVNTASFKDRKPWEFSRRSRSYFYDAPGAAAGPPNASILKKQCEGDGSRGVAGRWTDGRPAS